MTESNTRFEQLGLDKPLLRAVADVGYTTATPIQAQAIPPLLEGQDLLGIAQTGTGKTAAFMLPILQRLSASKRPRVPRAPRALVLAPTRELAAQVEENTAAYAKHLPMKTAVIFGGVGQRPQVQKLKAGLDVLVGCPGRILDLIGQGELQLDRVEAFVLDEADRMLDMGFIHDVKKIIARLPQRRHTLLFSATMPDAIAKLSQQILIDPVRVEVTPPSTTVERIDQRVMYVEKNDKRRLLVALLEDSGKSRSLVFARTKRGANRAAEFLEKAGIAASAIHGNKSQNARERALGAFRRGDVRVLVATDIAARGIDVPGIEQVINFDLPNVPEDYVHRIGRTGRAGREGRALSFCDVDERADLVAIQKHIRQQLPVVDNHPYKSTVPMSARPAPKPAKSRGGGGGGGGGNRPRRRGARR